MIEVNDKQSISNPLDEKIFHQIKTSLINKSGIRYIDFKKTVQPDYKKVWRDIALGWCSLIAILVIVFFATAWVHFFWQKILIVVTASVLAGLVISYLINFFHEAAHFNIAADKKTNDLLANIFLGSMQAQGIKAYRVVHWQHHVNHGDTNDPERSYFDALSLNFFIENLTGIRILKTILLRKKNLIESGGAKDILLQKKESNRMLVAGLIFHASVIGAFIYTQQYWVLATWLCGFGVFFPFFFSLRQLLEHRGDDAMKNIDYRKVNQGKTNRIFQPGFFASCLGSAGFTRHLLHHLEPQISYTNLGAIENFLLDTSLRPFVEKKQTTYFTIFKKLLGK